VLFSDRENGGDFGADCNLIIVPHLQVTADNESPHLYNRAISAGGGLLAGGNGKNGRHKLNYFLKICKGPHWPPIIFMQRIMGMNANRRHDPRGYCEDWWANFLKFGISSHFSILISKIGIDDQL
jgi:hypothetical protein